MTPGCGLVQPTATHPHLYHLHCDAAAAVSPQRLPGDGSAVLTAPLPTIYHDAPQTDIVLCNGWHDTFAKCPLPSFPAVSGLAFAAAAGTMSVSHADTAARGTVASVSVAGMGASSPWKMSSPAVFSAPVLPTQSSSTAIQPVPRFFQPPFYPDMVPAPVKFTGAVMPDCSGLAGTAGNITYQDGCGDEPMGKRFIPCWHSVAACTTSTFTVSMSPQTGVASKCLSASAVVSTPASAANIFSPVKSDKLPGTKTSSVAVGTVTSCQQEVCDNDADDDYDDDEDDDDDESVSDESSSTSNQKDGGKYCECWRCEFFGHADVRTCICLSIHALRGFSHTNEPFVLFIDPLQCYM